MGNSVVRLETWSTIVDGSMVQLDGIDLTSRQSDLSWLEVALKIPVRSARSLLRQIPLLPELERARDEAGGRRHHGNRIMEDRTLAPKVVEVTVRGHKLLVKNDRKRLLVCIRDIDDLRVLVKHIYEDLKTLKQEATDDDPDDLEEQPGKLDAAPGTLETCAAVIEEGIRRLKQIPGCRLAYWDKRGARFQVSIEKPLEPGRRVNVPVHGASKSIKAGAVEILRGQVDEAIALRFPQDPMESSETPSGDETPPEPDQKEGRDSSEDQDLDLDHDQATTPEGLRDSDQDLDAGTKRQRRLD